MNQFAVAVMGALGGTAALAAVNRVDKTENKMVVRTKSGIAKASESVMGGLNTLSRLSAWVFDRTQAIFRVAGEATGAIVVGSVAAKVVSAVFGLQISPMFSGAVSLVQRAFRWFRGALGV